MKKMRADIFLNSAYLKMENEKDVHSNMVEAKEQLLKYSLVFKDIKMKRYAVVCVKSDVYVEQI